MTNDTPRKKPGPVSEKDRKEAVLATAQKQLPEDLSLDKDNRDRVLKELKFAFIPGEQWDKKTRDDRKGQLCLEFNQLPSFVDQVTGANRKSKHSGKVHPESDEASQETAEIIEGFIRRVESRSHASIAYDNGKEQAATGWGYWRVRTDYEQDWVSEDTTDLDPSYFYQTVFIDPIPNRFSVVFGYSEQWHRQDAEHCFYLTSMSREAFRAKYKDAEIANFDDAQLNEVWYPNEDRVTLAEYFTKEYEQQKIYQLEDGRIVRELPPEVKDSWKDLLKAGLVRERAIDTFKIYRYLLSGHAVLEDKQFWPSRYWPIVPVDGKVWNINGEVVRTGVFTYGIDHQKALNYLLTTDVEQAAFAPKNPWVIEARQIKGYEEWWRTAHKLPYPFLPYQHVDGVPKPQREPAIQGAPTLLISANAHRDGLRMTTGGYGISSLDAVEEKSGVAIAKREAIGATGNFHYPDNADRSIKLTWEIIIDLIPTILDTNRRIQVEDVNGLIKFEEINKAARNPETQEIEILNDLSRGRYGVTITTGPAFETQRQETAQTLMDLSKLYPNAAPVLAPTVVKNLDFPGSSEVSKKLLVLAAQLAPQTLSEDERKEVEDFTGPQEPPPPDPKVLESQAKIQEIQQRLEMDLAKLRLEMEEIEAKTENLRSASIKNIAQAEAAEMGQNLEQYKLELEALNAKFGVMGQMQENQTQPENLPKT